ncbi:flagellar hook-basal body complex protein FliE [Pseudokineococcus lusitanus]|jgi:flagellar hook-basal body complex protein FliE|uniref:Flagellar hook-basal body complex protein FliE n=1 Tax=Pseudokineococcus lusitanus TaxID=763993 RepID=A0A3N1HQS6_9ACTN|nr:flagellar hook-basal body complex protein FliE [Pseudokineococcus lusitanus]ROP44841.1 flagellar hook-basal body complex protein FliE [Pseudokineococcus lusitanus]
MSVMGIEAVGARPVAATLPSLASLPTGAVGAAAPAGPASGEDVASAFGAALTRGIASVEAAEKKADGLAVQAATGTLTDVHDYVIAANQAKLATELTVAVRNKAVEAFSEIMRLQA